MDIKTAVQHVQSLADGIDPMTGEILPATSPYNNPEIIRAIFKVLFSVDNSKLAISTDASSGNPPARQGQRWTSEERQQLSDRFYQGETQASMARYHQRSIGAIRSELVRLGLIEEKS